MDIVDLVLVAREFGDRCPRADLSQPSSYAKAPELSPPSLFAELLLGVRRVFWVGAR